MNNEKTITICGKEVKLLYCAATENGYEELSDGKSISVFLPTLGKDKNGETIITEPAKANIGDFVKLAIAGIISAYARDKKEMPVTMNEILYNSTPTERNELITAIVTLRNEWYGVPKVLEESIKAEQATASDGSPYEEEKPKNA